MQQVLLLIHDLKNIRSFTFVFFRTLLFFTLSSASSTRFFRLFSSEAHIRTRLSCFLPLITMPFSASWQLHPHDIIRKTACICTFSSASFSVLTFFSVIIHVFFRFFVNFRMYFHGFFRFLLRFFPCLIFSLFPSFCSLPAHYVFFRYQYFYSWIFPLLALYFTGSSVKYHVSFRFIPLKFTDSSVSLSPILRTFGSILPQSVLF